MTNKYKPIITDVGMQVIIDSIANHTPIVLNKVAWGDGGGFEPSFTTSATSLVNEKKRVDTSGVIISPDCSLWLDIYAVLPRDAGNYYVREVGVFTESGVLFCVAAHPTFYKTNTSEGTVIDLTEKFTVEIDRLAEVNIVLSPSNILASKEDIENHIHNGNTGNPSKIDLTDGNEVKGKLPFSFIDLAFASNGSVAMTGNINVNNHQLNNLALPMFSGDGVNRQYIDTFKAGRAPKDMVCSIVSGSTVTASTGGWLDSTANRSYITTSTVAKDLAGIWNETGSGGLPSILATPKTNTCYHFFAIGDGEGNTNYGFDTSPSAINLFADTSKYTTFKRLDSFWTGSDAVLIPKKSIENNDGSIECFYLAPQLVLDTTSPNVIITDLNLKTPYGFNTKAKLLVKYTKSGSTSSVTLTSPYVGNSTTVCSVETSTAPTTRECIVDVFTSTTGTIQYKVADATTSDLKIYLLGYTDGR